MTSMRICVVAIALTIELGSARGADPIPASASERSPPGATYTFRRMADGKEWMTSNLNVEVSPSYCYDDVRSNCRLYGRLYTWESAQQACRLLGDGWRLPTDDDWRQMAKNYGGVSADSTDGGRAAFAALSS